MRKPIRVVSSQELLLHPRQHIVADRLLLPSGREYDYIYRKARGTGVYVVAVTEGGCVLFVKQYRHPVGAETLELPAGGRNADESVEVCAARELYEETGYICSEPAYVGQLAVSPASTSGSVHVCCVDHARKVADPQNSDEEHTEVIEIPKRDLQTAMANGLVNDAGTLASLMLAWEWLFG